MNRAARALAGRYTVHSKREASRSKGYSGLATGLVAHFTFNIISIFHLDISEIFIPVMWCGRYCLTLQNSTITRCLRTLRARLQSSHSVAARGAREASSGQGNLKTPQMAALCAAGQATSGKACRAVRLLFV